jgi:hypothetical protein
MSDAPESAEVPGEPRKKAATILADIATDLFTFHRTADTRADDGEVVSDGHLYARPKANPGMTRNLEDIRPDLAAVYMAEHGQAAARGDLAEAMTVLVGFARRASPDAPTAPEQVSELLGQVPGDRGLSLVTKLDDCPLPEGYVVPEPYVVTADGVHLVKDDGAGHARVTWAWLFPVRVYVDPAGDHLVELAWRDRSHWVSRLVRRAITKSGRKLVTEAGDAGRPVIEAEARQAERWLAAAEAANHGVIVRHPVARQLGWQADGRTFITGQDAPWRVEPKYAEQAGPLAAHHPRGTLATWQEVIQGAENYIVVRVGLYAGLAAALLVPLGVDSFTLDISGKSTRGKTITAMVAMSCWADPGSKGDAMLSWQARSVFPIEKRLNLVNGLVTVIDETRLVKDPAVVDTVLYLVPKNHGAPRGGGWPNMIPWRTIVISTGEQPAVSFTTHQGASARVLSIIQRAPFGTDGTESRDAAKATEHGVEENYGTAGPAFVRLLQSKLAEDGGLGKLRARHGELTELLAGGTDMTGRRAPLIACLALAAELAAEWEIVPFAAPEVSAWLGLFNSADQQDNRPEMALDIVREYLAAHADKMYGAGDGEHPPATGWIGHQAKEGPALLPEKLREELKRRGYELDAVLPGWLEMGALVTMDSQRPSHLIPRRTAGHQTKHLIFRRDVIDSDGA